MTDIGQIFAGIGSIGQLADSILSRADRDHPDNQRNENISTIQNAFASNNLDSDEFRLFIDKLLNNSGYPITPTKDPSVGRRELFHALLVNTVQLIYERELFKRVVQSQQK